MFSGGKDSLVTLISSGCKECVYMKTGVGLNQDYAQSICDKNGVYMHIIEPLPRFSYEEFVKRHSFPHQGMHSAVFGYLKWFSLRRFAREHKTEDVVFLSGRRKRESKRRLLNPNIKAEDWPEKNIHIKAPLFTWSNADVWEYIKQQNLDISPCYWDLDISGDCLCGSMSTNRESRILWNNPNYRALAEWLKSLEDKYGGHWGNGSSLTGVSKETKLEAYGCYECFIHATEQKTVQSKEAKP